MIANTPDDRTMLLQRDGAMRIAAALDPSELAELRCLVDELPRRAGVRLERLGSQASSLMTSGVVAALVADVLGAEVRPVRAVVFDKTPETNWRLGWHQDRTIVVKKRIEAPGFGPWSTKAGLQHVAPPFDLLERMITVRVHLDAIGRDNAPLLIAPGSHAFGLIPIHAVKRAVERCGQHACLAQAGDVWIYKTPILHASEAATRPSRRRVIQIDYATFDLPFGLEWLGV